MVSEIECAHYILLLELFLLSDLIEQYVYFQQLLLHN